MVEFFSITAVEVVNRADKPLGLSWLHANKKTIIFLFLGVNKGTFDFSCGSGR